MNINRQAKSLLLGVSTLVLAGLASSSAVRAASCGDGSVAASGASCAFAGPNFNPADNDDKNGSIVVNGGASVTLDESATNIVAGSPGTALVPLNSAQAAGAAGNIPRLTLGNKTQSIASPDPITGSIVTIATYNTSAITQTNYGDVNVVVPVNTGDNQYIDARFGTVDGTAGGGTLVVDIGDPAQDTLAAENLIGMRSKATTLAKAEGPNSTVEWASRNNVRMDMSVALRDGYGQNSYFANSVGNFGVTFTAFDGSTWTVTNAAELQAYNAFLIAAVQNGDLNSQQAYDVEFAKGATISAQTLNYTTPLNPGDDSNIPLGVQYIIHADGAGARGVVSDGAQIDHRLTGNIGGAALYATNGGHVEVCSPSAPVRQIE